MDNVYNRLNTDYGAILMDPPYHAHAFDGALAVIYNAGVKENAGVFSQSQGWLIRTHPPPPAAGSRSSRREGRRASRGGLNAGGKSSAPALNVRIRCPHPDWQRG